MKKLACLLLLVTIAVQFAIPAIMIRQKERILQNGTVHRFRAQPVDPADPFQGRYVQLSFEQDYISCAEHEVALVRRGEHLYVTLNKDVDGFTVLADWSRARPETGEYLKTPCGGKKWEWNREIKTNVFKGISFDLPFDRFYMDEAKAPRAEKAVRDAIATTNCWADVRILNGAAVIEDVVAEGRSLRIIAAESE
ncbi:MAG: GDYXXLXY domain-containing protein [Kiritimatiellales bacterium]|nr:GDYXXLXY domain-containing protein [Kiritimatiellales bacterium]